MDNNEFNNDYLNELLSKLSKKQPFFLMILTY